MPLHHVTEQLMGDIEARWPNKEVLTPGGLTKRYEGELARHAFIMFQAEAEGARHILLPNSFLAIALKDPLLDGWSIDFAAREEKVTYQRLGRIIDTHHRNYFLRMSVLPPLPPNQEL